MFSNARCTVGACKPAPHGWLESFNTAFRAGGVMGFSLCGLALLCLYFLLCVFSSYYDPSLQPSCIQLMDCIAGFGLGGEGSELEGKGREGRGRGRGSSLMDRFAGCQGRAGGGLVGMVSLRPLTSLLSHGSRQS